MSVKIICDCQDVQAALFDGQTEKMIGNLIWARKVNGIELTASEIAEKFIEWSAADICDLSYAEWELQWAMFQEFLNKEE